MAKRKQPVEEEKVIFDLSDLVEFQITKILYDGTKRKRATLYLVKVRRIGKTSRARKAARPSTPPSTRDGGLYVLKITLANEDDYKRELAANIVLSRGAASSDAQTACDALTAPSEDPRTSRWPRCLGILRTGKDLKPGNWVRSDTGSDRSYALLFEYIPDLEPITRELVTEELFQEYKQVLADLHALKILHRDQILRAAWPQIAFNNVFLRKNESTGTKEIVILDFDKALVLGDNTRDTMLLQNEAKEMEEAFGIALSKIDMIESLPKEARKLL